VFEISFARDVAADLRALTARQRSMILDQIDVQLKGEPHRETRNRKPLVGLVPPWDHTPPVWELRLGDFRVFYDVDEPSNIVVVWAIRRKLPDQTTEDIL
jgi:mRNA-degrading endonuclease RelE of RelBE toxin-antitoxin system